MCCLGPHVPSMMMGPSWQRMVAVGAALNLLSFGKVAALVGAVARVDEGQFLQTGASHTDSWLEHWLASLEFIIPDSQTTVMGFDVELKGGVCNGLSLDDIFTRKSGTKAMVDARGLAISCRLEWSFGSLAGGVVATVSNSSMRGSLMLVPDHGSPPMPSAILSDRADCGGVIKVSHLEFTGGVLSEMLEFFHNFIEKKLTQDLASIICTQVDKAVSEDATHVLRAQVELARTYLSKNITSPQPSTNLSDPKGDFVDFTSNPGLKLLARLTSEVLGNESSPHSLDAIASHYLGPSGDFSLDSAGIFPVSQVVRVPKVGMLNVTISSLEFGDLNTWSDLDIKAVDAHQLSMAFKIGEIVANASISLVVAPDDADPGVHGSTLQENFDVSVTLHGLGASAGFFVGMNGTYLQTLSPDQLASVGCLIPGLVSPQASSAGFKLELAETRITPRTGTLEKDLDGMLNMMVDDVLRDYAQALEAVGNQLLAVTAHQAVNDKLHELWALPPVCPDAAPTFSNPAVSEDALVAALALAALALLVLMLAACLGGFARKAVAPECQNPGAAPLTTESAAPAAPEACAARATVEAREVTAIPMDDLSLSKHPRLPWSARLALPALVITTMLLFASSNSGEGAIVRMAVTADGESIVDLPPLFSFSLISSIRDMWTGGAYPLAILIGLFSGVWPYGKLMLMLLCFFAPPRILSVKRRQRLLDFLDAYGKWSLVDTFVMVLFMVAFHLELSGMDAASPVVAGMFHELGSDAKLAVFIEPTVSFYSFLVATVLSLALGHGMTAFHRRALQIGEYSAPEEYLGEGTASSATRYRLCQRFSRNRFDRYGPVVAVAVSLVLVIAGLCVDTMEFRFMGLTNFALGPEASVRPYSIISLDLGLPWSTDAPNGIGIRSIQVAFLFFAAVFTPVYLSILLVLWTAPLPASKQRHFLVAAQVLNAWSGLEVFCVSIAASVLEIRQFAAFMVGHRCDLLNEIVARSPIAKQIEGAPTCFDVISELKPGLYILSVAAIIAVVTGQVLLSRCSTALFEPNATSESAGSSSRSSIATAISQPSASAVPQPCTLLQAEP
mmetsp:Transcript_46696/g.117526  ORF Transcript_46696/g.117526 Transcript_46696/m.117526 type:complete len:1072 (+) Transcript_46696:19-3234(+)